MSIDDVKPFSDLDLSLKKDKLLICSYLYNTSWTSLGQFIQELNTKNKYACWPFSHIES